MASQLPALVTADLEGVFIPEVWIAVANATGIERLMLTTRDIVDYDELMNYRMSVLREHNLTLGDIQDVIAGMEPLPEAVDFINWIRERTQLIILTDSFYQFVEPFMPKLEYPTIFAHQIGHRRPGDDLRISSTLQGQQASDCRSPARDWLQGAIVW